MISYCCEKKIAGVLPTATGPAKHLFRQIEKKTWAIVGRVHKQYPVSSNNCWSFLTPLQRYRNAKIFGDMQSMNESIVEDSCIYRG